MSETRKGLPAIEFQSVSKVFGPTKAVQELSFQVNSGELVAILGPNGAGKSTTLEMLLGLQRPTSGQIRVFGEVPGSRKARSFVGVTPQDVEFPPHLQVGELLAWASAVHGRTDPSLLTESFGLRPLLGKINSSLSGGERRRLGLALAFLGNPRLVILDEPTNGLDVLGKSQLWEWMENYVDQGGTLVLTTHDLFELKRLAHRRMLMINKGRLVQDGRVQDLMQKCAFKRISFQTQESVFWPANVRFEKHGDLHLGWTHEPEKILHQFWQQNLSLTDLQVEPGRLEDVFEFLQGRAD